MRFVTVVTILGINNAKPLRILELMPPNYGLTTQMIGSKLQKYKSKISKKYNLPSLKLIRNYMYAEVDDDVVRMLASKWLDSRFSGY